MGFAVLKWLLGGPEECRSGASKHGVSLEGDLVGVLVRYNLQAIMWLKLWESGGPQCDVLCRTIIRRPICEGRAIRKGNHPRFPRPVLQTGTHVVRE